MKGGHSGLIEFQFKLVKVDLFLGSSVPVSSRNRVFDQTSFLRIGRRYVASVMFVAWGFRCLCVCTYTPDPHYMVVLFTLVNRNGKQLFSNTGKCFCIPSIPVSPLGALFPSSLTQDMIMIYNDVVKTDLFMINIKIRQQKEECGNPSWAVMAHSCAFGWDADACWGGWLTAPVFESWIHLHSELPYTDRSFWFLCCIGNRIEERSV